MRYKAALAIGHAEGTIQCTYAMIYDKNGNKLFALQRRNFRPDWEEIVRLNSGNSSYDKSGSLNIVTYTGYGGEGIIGWDTGSAQTEMTETAYITFDMPLVRAKKWSNDQLVPVTLLYDAIAYIKQTLASAKDYKMYQLCKPDGSVEKLVLDKEEADKWSADHDYENAVRIVYQKLPRWTKISEALNDTDTFYVKPAAFDWQPVNILNTIDSDGIPIAEKVRVSKEALDRARKILIASTATLAI